MDPDKEVQEPEGIHFILGSENLVLGLGFLYHGDNNTTCITELL